MANLDELAQWLKANDLVGGAFDRELDQLAQEWRQSHEELELAIGDAKSRLVAEDEIGFLETVEPVQAALARHRISVSLWESFLDKIKPRVEPLG